MSRVVACGVAAAGILTVTACGTGTPPTEFNGVTAPPGTVVMIIRHGEKPDGTGPGIDPTGRPDSSSLTQVGWTRARRLADLFAPVQGSTRPGVVRPVAIYAAGANSSGEGARTRETVAPLAQRLGIRVNTAYGKGDEDALIAEVASKPGPTLICWQHGEIPALAQAFGSVAPSSPSDWPDDRFDVIWIFTATASGWTFAQVPESVLPADSGAGIAS